MPFAQKRGPNSTYKGKSKALTHLEVKVELSAISKGPRIFKFLARFPREGEVETLQIEEHVAPPDIPEVGDVLSRDWSLLGDKTWCVWIIQ